MWNELLDGESQNVSGSAYLFKKLALPSSSGIQLVDLGQIIRLEAQNNYTLLFTLKGKEIMISKPLSKLDASLDSSIFIRVHKSHVINLLHAIEYKNGDDQVILMRDNSAIQISRRRLGEFKEALKKHFVFVQ